MSGSVNKVIIVGNLGRDPEIRHLQSGDKVANFSVAVTERWKDKQTGERKEATEWVPVVLFGPLAGIAEQYLRKGSKVLVEGKFKTRKWTDQSGNDRSSTEVVCSGFGATLEMLDGKPSGGGDDRQRPQQGGGYSAPAGGGMEDDIPFFMEWRA